MYTTGDITNRLNISRPTLYKLCKQKKIFPKKTPGGNHRYSEIDFINLLNDFEIDDKNIEDKFIKMTKDIWLVLTEFSKTIWGNDFGEQKLKEIVQKNELFIMNVSRFK